MKLLTSVIALCLILEAFGFGKEKKVPNLPPLPLPKLHPPQADIVQEVATCYQGYTLLSDGKCVKEIVEEPLPAEGHVLVPYITLCPPGYIAAEGACVMSEEVPPEFFCPIGFVDDGLLCAQTLPGETTLSCHEGELIGNTCVLSEHAPHLVTPKCPEGSSVEKDGNCWKVVELFDCTPGTGKEPISGRVIAPPKPHVPLGKKIIVSKGKAKLRALHAKKEHLPEEPKLPYGPPSKNSVAGVLISKEPLPPKPAVAVPLPVPTACPKKEMISVAPPRPTKVGVASQTCAKKVQVDAIALVSCPDGFEDFGEDCLKELTFPPDALCLTDGSVNGPCPPFVRHVPKYPQCLSGGKPDAFGKCIELSSLPAENVCAEGFKDTGNGCTAKVNSGGLECRPGLELVGDKCIGKSIRPSVSLSLKPKPGCENKY